MREIKFRFWNKEIKQWLQYEEVFIDEEGEVWIIEERSFAYQTYMNKENITEKVEVMQYTGLKDKNGIEIYEGDIVKGHWWKKGNAHRHLGRVTYVMSSFKVRGVKQYLGLDDELNPTYEIIGNIYEHPHLLEVD